LRTRLRRLASASIQRPIPATARPPDRQPVACSFRGRSSGSRLAWITPCFVAWTRPFSARVRGLSRRGPLLQVDGPIDGKVAGAADHEGDADEPEDHDELVPAALRT